MEGGSSDEFSCSLGYSWVGFDFFLSIGLLYSCKTNKRARSSIFAPVPVNFIAGGLGLSDLECLLMVVYFPDVFPV